MDTLIDSQVLIRAHDSHAEPFAIAAILALRRLSETGQGALSAQSLAEFATYATYNFSLKRTVIAEQLELLGIVFPVLPITAGIVAAAVRLESRRRIGHYEAQVMAVAQANGLKFILSEDRQNRWSRDDVVYLNFTRHANTRGWRGRFPPSEAHA
ncbi:MAG TPA: PIN domain-containing protein [Trueperaceae bacterium]|nr:PIN domain-containing protein [Trueperaceae bacterium]